MEMHKLKPAQEDFLDNIVMLCLCDGGHPLPQLFCSSSSHLHIFLLPSYISLLLSSLIPLLFFSRDYSGPSKSLPHHFMVGRVGNDICHRLKCWGWLHHPESWDKSFQHVNSRAFKCFFGKYSEIKKIKILNEVLRIWEEIQISPEKWRHL